MSDRSSPSCSSPSVFTTYLRSLEASGEPDPASFERLWQVLRGVLRSEIKRRGLWEGSPALLGVHGWESWRPVAGGSDALDELAADCYVYVFVRRLHSLRAHLRHKPNVDGLVFRCISNLLHDAQKRQDPLGFRLFSLLKATLRQLVRQGVLQTLSGGERIGNETVFSWRPSSARTGTAPVRAEPSDLEGIVRSWSDELLFELVSGRGAACDDVVARLQDRILALAEHGVEAFRMGDVVDPLKADVRARWGVLFEGTEGERAFEDLESGQAEAVRLSRPDRGFEERQSFDHLVASVTEGLNRLEVRGRTREYLVALWSFLQAFAVEADGERLPSRRELARQLRIPRDRLPELYEILQRLIAGSSVGKPGHSRLRRS